MRAWDCVCDNTLFYENSLCTRCGREVGWCPSCKGIAPVDPLGNGRWRCAKPECGAELVKCHNYAVENVCNRFVMADQARGDGANPLCDCCRFNDTIPDLTIPKNRELWARLEAAKRRLFFQLDLLGLPRGNEDDGFQPPLSFDFKADAIPQGGSWRKLDAEHVYTGHAEGKITINIREADDAERERMRLDMGESYRTLLGHFRHEVGHYYWELLIKGKREPEFKAVFGDHENPSYADALDRHYREGAPTDWALRYTTAYASMHPWEDWAETWALYLEIVSTLDTAKAWGLGGPGLIDDLPKMVHAHQRLGVALNEMNRAMGLHDILTRLIVPPVIEKLGFIHTCIRDAATYNLA